jgi:hypothetical protein
LGSQFSVYWNDSLLIAQPNFRQIGWS